MSENNKPQQAKNPYQNLYTLLFGYDFSYSADLATHFFISQIVLKWCFCEKVVADIWREINRQNPKLRKKPIPNRQFNQFGLAQFFKELCKDIRKIPTIRERPNFRKIDFKKIEEIIRELEKTFNVIRENRHTLVHGKMLFEENTPPDFHIPDSSKSYRSPLRPFYTSRIVMRRQGNNEEKVIHLEQEELRRINERFDKFINLMRELFIELYMGNIHILIDYEIKDASDPRIGFDRHGTKTASSHKELSPKDIPNIPLPPVGLPKSKHCRMCKQDFVGDEVCRHLEMMNEILTGE